MKIKEIKKEFEKSNNLYKVLILSFLVILTVVMFFIKYYDISINWEILGFIGVILTIRASEKSRIKQNKFEYQKEKITDEQIEFKHVIKDKVDFLDITTLENEIYLVNEENYLEATLKINTYISKLNNVENDILWFYEKGEITADSEIKEFIEKILELKKLYSENLNEYTRLLLNFNCIKMHRNYDQVLSVGDLPETLVIEINKFKKENKSIQMLYEEIKDNQFKILGDLIRIRNDKALNLYSMAQKVVEERDRWRSKRIM